MIEKTMTGPNVTEHELSEIKALIEKRSAILFDSSRERFFSLRVREHMDAKKVAHGTDLIRLLKSSNVEYDSLVERLLTQETSFFRYPSIYHALEKKVLPEIHMKRSCEKPPTLCIRSARCGRGKEPYPIALSSCHS